MRYTGCGWLHLARAATQNRHPSAHLVSRCAIIERPGNSMPSNRSRKGRDKQRQSSGQKPQSSQNSSGGQKPAGGITPPSAMPPSPAPRPKAADQPAPQPTGAAQAPEPPSPEATTTTERGTPREEHVSMQTAS